MIGRAILDRSVIHVADAETDPGGHGVATARTGRGYPGILGVPMLREGTSDRRDRGGSDELTEARPFSDREIALLKTFADQAVIAVENVRLFQELEARNQALSEALEQQTATSEILQVISSSPTDVQPVFDTIVLSAVRLCDGLFGSVSMFDGEMVHRPAAYHNYTPDALAAVERMYPMRPSHTS